MAASKWCLFVNTGLPSIFVSGLSRHVSVRNFLPKTYMSTLPNIDLSKGPAISQFHKTSESDPTKHTLKHEAMFYQLPDEDVKLLFPAGTFYPLHVQQNNAFQETRFMIRRPALEIFHYLQTANYSHPVIRYVLYGLDGVGKTMTLSHVVHFCSRNGWLLLHIPNMFRLLYCIKEIQTSSYNPNRIDIPLESVDWLKLFKQQNQQLLKDKQFKTTKKYVWNKREFLEEGESWEELINQGINRVKYASDCVGALLREVKLQSATSGIKTLVAIDGVNTFFQESKLIDDQKKPVPAGNISVVHAFKKMLQNNWTNGAVVVTVDTRLKTKGEMDGAYLPRALLRREGFELLDPFVPICVDKYSDKEMQTCLDYYIDKRLLQNEKAKTDNGRKELMFLSGGKPYTLSYLCSVY